MTKGYYINILTWGIWLKWLLFVFVDTSDFFGMNHYTTTIVTTHINPIDQISYNADQDVQETHDPSWPR